MDDNILRQWQNLATERLNLRFPKIDLKVNRNHLNDSIVETCTFVQDKSKTKLVLVRGQYYCSYDMDIFKFLKEVEHRFIIECEKTKDHYIFKNGNFIYEPYEINKL